MIQLRVSEAEKAEIKRKLTLTNTYSEEKVILYEELPDGTINVPRGCVPHETQHTHQLINFNLNCQLRPEQRNVFNRTLRHFEVKDGGIIKADTGTGKTVIAIAIIQMMSLKTLIVVPTSHLMTQWRERLKTFSDLTDDNIGTVVQNQCDYRGPVTIGMIHSLSKKGKYPSGMYNAFDLVIWDEVHRLGAPTFSETGKLFNSAYRLGLSATPKRKDGMEPIFKAHIGEVIKTGIVQTIKPTVLVLKYEDLDGNHSRYVFGGEFNIGAYTTHIATRPSRNKLIVMAITAAHSKGRKILVLSDRLDQLNYIKKQLGTIPLGWFTGGKKSGHTRDIILATYGSAGLGADLPDRDTVIFATPRAEVEQATGRILRGVTAKEPLVVDILDTRSTMMNSWYGVRKRFYLSKGYEIKER
jgi:superfamily II DNA or RNA helicase